MGICQSNNKPATPYCELCNEYINTKQLVNCVKCKRKYHIRCFTVHVEDKHTCPICKNEVTKFIKNESIDETTNLTTI